jgi:hypothetical protein
MRTVFRRKVRWVHLLGGAILVWAALMNSARADVFRVNLLGSYNSNTGPQTFATSFYIDNRAPACDPNCVSSLAGGQWSYKNTTIFGLAPFVVSGVSYNQTDFFISPFIVIGLLASGTSPLFSWEINPGPVPNGEIILGQFNNTFVQRFTFVLPVLGVVIASVLGFDGDPRTANCHGKSTSTLAHKYRGLREAAIALNYKSVSALQADIMLFCGS